MIVALSGSLSAGKTSIAEYLVSTFNFKQVNLIERFAQETNPELQGIEQYKAFYARKCVFTDDDAAENREKVIQLQMKVFDEMKHQWKQPYVFYPYVLNMDIEPL